MFRTHRPWEILFLFLSFFPSRFSRSPSQSFDLKNRLLPVFPSGFPSYKGGNPLVPPFQRTGFFSTFLHVVVFSFFSSVRIGGCASFERILRSFFLSRLCGFFFSLSSFVFSFSPPFAGFVMILNPAVSSSFFGAGVSEF